MSSFRCDSISYQLPLSVGESFSVSQWVIVSNWRYVANASPSFVSLLIFHNHASKYITHHKLEMMFFSFSMPGGGSIHPELCVTSQKPDIVIIYNHMKVTHLLTKHIQHKYIKIPNLRSYFGLVRGGAKNIGFASAVKWMVWQFNTNLSSFIFLSTVYHSVEHLCTHNVHMSISYAHEHSLCDISKGMNRYLQTHTYHTSRLIVHVMSRCDDSNKMGGSIQNHTYCNCNSHPREHVVCELSMCSCKLDQIHTVHSQMLLSCALSECACSCYRFG